MATFRELLVWQKSIEFVTMIYDQIKPFPKEEMFGLTSQIRRAAISIPSNIAEGSSFRSNKEFNHFLNIALGSSYELETQIIISKNQLYISEIWFNELIDKLVSIQKMITALKKSLII